jgi:hypothetical protein
MDFDAHVIEKEAAAAGSDAMHALAQDYARKSLQFFGAWIIGKRVDMEALGEEYATAAAVGWAEAILKLPGFAIDRADFDELPIFYFDFKTPEMPARTSRLRFGDTWFVWKRSAISIPMAMIYRVNISPGPRRE